MHYHMIDVSFSQQKISTNLREITLKFILELKMNWQFKQDATLLNYINHLV